MAVTHNCTPNTGFLCSSIFHFLDISLTFSYDSKIFEWESSSIGSVNLGSIGSDRILNCWLGCRRQCTKQYLNKKKAKAPFWRIFWLSGTFNLRNRRELNLPACSIDQKFEGVRGKFLAMETALSSHWVLLYLSEDYTQIPFWSFLIKI